ncbi:MAG: 3-deoxy-7-phosphoheptulonate synthase [Verrucomicrobia bacterium]|nr:3-deoxy-7-phosphoheptulonate synthase [Verrucomicrobiota bacterium]
MTKAVSDINIVDSVTLPAPEYFCRETQRSETAAEFVADSRSQIHRILFGDDKRLLVVVGPCSIHDTAAGLDYARRLADLAKKVESRMKIVMRVYFEKPRTTVGWKGLIMDPMLDGSCNIPLGLKIARRFLLDVLDLGLPTATELLDPITPQYIADLICWSAIGARTTESQTHRQMASGLSMPLGFKNGTTGDIVVALNAIKAACQPQTFLGINQQGLACALTTRGNPACHLILRGGATGSNYDESSVQDAAAVLANNSLPTAIMIDCSHGNSDKDHRKQPAVFNEFIRQVLNPASPVMGAMLESNILDGAQSFPRPKSDLVYGQSITDKCIDWSVTESLLLESFERLAPRFA